MTHDPNHPDHPLHAHSHETAPLHDAPDQWHDHTADEKPQHAHAEVGNALGIMTIGISLFLVIVLSSVAVYAYYMWFLSQRLNEQEVAYGSDQHSPATIARQYKRDTIRRLEVGGPVSIKASDTLPALNYSLKKIDDAIAQVAADYSKAAPPPAAPASPVAPRPAPAGQ